MASKVQLAGILLVLGIGRSASAEVEAQLTVVPEPGAPRIDALIMGGPLLPMQQVVLRDPRGVLVPGAEVTDFRSGKRSIAVAVVFNGQEVWVGNDQIEPADSPALYLGALEGIRRGVDALDLVHTTSAGSKAMLITYDDQARIRLPLGPVSRLTGAAVGTQRDYYSRIGTSLVEGTTLAIDELEHARTDKKLVIVVSDGNDTNNEAARVQFAELKKRAASDRIRVAAIIYKGQLSDPDSVITALAPNAAMVNSFEGIAEAMRDALRRETTEYTVRFPGHRLSWDGTVQELTVQIGRDDLEPVAVQMGQPRKPAAETPWFLRWWAQLAAGLLLVGAIIGVQRVRGSRAI
jgi:hypothetical protein